MTTRTNTGRRWWGMCIGIAAILTVGVLALAALLGYFYFYGKVPWRTAEETTTGPAVTIQSPAPGTQVKLGDSIPFLAYATDQQGVARLDLWVDDVLVFYQSSPQGAR